MDANPKSEYSSLALIPDALGSSCGESPAWYSGADLCFPGSRNQARTEAKLAAEEQFQPLVDLYQLSLDRGATQRTLDSLTEGEKRIFIQAFARMFGGGPAFPSLSQVSETIEQHALCCLELASRRLGVKVVYSGYDAACSIARKLALPASDIDHWSVIIDAPPAFSQLMKEEIQRNMNPLISDLLHSSHQPPLVTTLQEVLNTSSISGGTDSFYLYRLPYASWEANIAEWKESGPLVSKPYCASSRAERDQLFAALGNDHCKNTWLNASCALEILREGVTLVDRLDPQTRSLLESSELFASSDILKQKRNSEALQSKHRARDSFSDFDSLSVDEQFLVLRIILERHLWQDSEHHSLLSLDLGNPNLPLVQVLLRNGFLCYADPGLKTATPAELPPTYLAHKPYIVPGRYASAPWHSHYPFERGLAFDY